MFWAGSPILFSFSCVDNEDHVRNGDASLSDVCGQNDLQENMKMWE